MSSYEYKAANYDQVLFRVKKGRSAEYTAAAEAMGIGRMEMLRRAVDEFIARHGGEQQDARADETAAEHVGKIGTSDDQNASGDENPMIITQRTENAQNQPVSNNVQTIQPPAKPATERITGTKKKLIEAVNNLPPHAQKNLLNFLESLRT